MQNTQRPLIKRQTLTGTVAEELRRRIVAGEYADGEQIRQEALAAELGVSRIPIREALLQLESEGLVVIHAHRGAVVAALTADDAEELFEARLLIEPAVLRKAMALSGPEHLARVRSCLMDYERAAKSDADPEELSRLNWAFHTALCRPANRPRMMSVLLSLYTATDRYLRLQIQRPDAKTRALADHRALLDAYEGRKTSAVAKLIKEHIMGAYDDVMESLERRARKTG
jgi:DNA-binding GntR family transcriptional regulator